MYYPAYCQSFGNMNWTTFIITVGTLYLLWYAGNIIRDMLFSGQVAKTGNGSIVYDLTDIMDEIEVEEMVELDPLTDKGHSKDTLTNRPLTQEAPPPSTDVITFDPPEGGLAMDEFLRQAKMRATASASKIQFAN